jgi:rod shape-determining protein MreD
MRLTIAAALAVVAALAEFTVAPYLKIGDAVPHLVLVFGVIAAVAGGLEVGLAWAFIGGLALDIVGQRPLGSSAFSLLIAIAIGSLVGGALGRVRIVAPIVATLVASIAYSILLLVSTTALTTVPITSSAMGAVLPSAVYDTILAALFGPLVVAIVAHRREAERVDW